MAQESRDFAAEWADLHGHPWPTAAAQLAPDAATELAGMRSAGFLDAPNLFEAAVAASRGADRLLLWGPFLNVAPMHALDNGDVLHVHVPSPRLAGARPAIVVWDHQRDLFEAPRPGDLGGLAPGDPANPLRFCVRSLYIVEALARGRFELDLFTAFDHPVIEAARPDYQANLRDYPPTALYALWHLWFAKDDARLNMLLPVVAQSPSRWIRDCGRLMQQILAGRNELGAITDLRALREQAATVINDPVVRERAAATRRRADLDAFLAGQRGLRLVRTDRQGKPCETATRARLDNGLELTVTAAGPRTSLVLRRDGRALSAFALSGDGGNARHEHSVQVAGGKAAVLYRRSSRDHPQFPRDGQLTLLGLRDNRLAPITSLAFDLDGLELD
ncbi:MAG: hypothetical protein KJ044_15205, partial [Planctomycetes bacterium]|nr:hypothetical protein [Planctomycetota bacterium]